MSVKDELTLVEGLDISNVRDVEAIILSNGKHTLKKVLPEQERPEGTIGYKVLLSTPGGVLKGGYVSIDEKGLRIVYKVEEILPIHSR